MDTYEYSLLIDNFVLYMFLDPAWENVLTQSDTSKLLADEDKRKKTFKKRFKIFDELFAKLIQELTEDFSTPYHKDLKAFEKTDRTFESILKLDNGLTTQLIDDLMKRFDKNPGGKV